MSVPFELDMLVGPLEEVLCVAVKSRQVVGLLHAPVTRTDQLVLVLAVGVGVIEAPVPAKLPVHPVPLYHCIVPPVPTVATFAFRVIAVGVALHWSCVPLPSVIPLEPEEGVFTVTETEPHPELQQPLAFRALTW
jgi:hypothetical protein